MAEGVRLTSGVADTPVPDSGTVCGDPEALSVKVRLALRAPEAVGVKVTLLEQLAPDASVVTQLVVLIEKSPGLDPVRVTAEIVTELPAPEVLVVTTACEGVVLPTVVEANVKLAGAKETVSVAPTIAVA